MGTKEPVSRNKDNRTTRERIHDNTCIKLYQPAAFQCPFTRNLLGASVFSLSADSHDLYDLNQRLESIAAIPLRGIKGLPKNLEVISKYFQGNLKVISVKFWGFQLSTSVASASFWAPNAICLQALETSRFYQLRCNVGAMFSAVQTSRIGQLFWRSASFR